MRLLILMAGLVWTGSSFAGSAPTSNGNAKTPLEYWPDTISTTCLSLIVYPDLSLGREEIDGLSMGYPDTDCDTSADNYLYTGSPIIGYKTGEHARMNWSAFGAWSGDSIGFKPFGNPVAGIEVIGSHSYETYDARSYALDSGLVIESKSYAPQGIENCNFILRRLTIYDNPDDGANDHTGLVIGEVFDWDVPSDTGLRNGSMFDEDLMAIWQQGAYYEDTTDGPCLPYENNTRYAGWNFLTMCEDDGGDLTSVTDGEGRPYHNAFTGDNPTYVYGNDNGFNSDTLYELMTFKTGMLAYYSAVPDSDYADLHMVVTYQHDYTLVASTELIIWSAIWSLPIGSNEGDIATVVGVNRSIWCDDFLLPGYKVEPYDFCTCCITRGNVDDLWGGATIDVSDLTYLAAYLFTGGLVPPCIDGANVDGLEGAAGPIDVSDLTFLVAYLFTGGAAPPPC